MSTAAKLGKLKVDLVLDRAAFQQGIEQAKSGIQRFSTDVSKRLNGLGNLPGIRSLQQSLSVIGKGSAAAVATGVGAAATALAGLSLSAIKTADDINNLSRLANATPQDFQGWAAGARTVGIEQEKLSDILKDVNDRVGDFISTGGGPMKDFFEKVAPKVGVTADQFRKLSGPQALQLYVDSLEKANVNQQDFTFYMEAMAGDSTALLPLLRNGGKAMQDYADRAAALGGVMSNQTVRALSGMKTSLGEVGTVMRGVRNELGAAFAPVIESLAQGFVSLMTKGSGLRMVFDGVAAVVGVIARLFSSAVSIVSLLADAVWQLGKRVAGVIDQFTGLSTVIKGIITNSPVGWIYKIITGFGDLIKAQGSTGAAIKALGEMASTVWSAMVESAKGIPVGLEAIWHTVRAGFYSMIADLQLRWTVFLIGVGNSMKDSGFWLLEGLAKKMGDAANSAGDSWEETGKKISQAQADAAGKASESAAIVQAAWDPVTRKWKDLTTITEEATDALGGPGGSSGLSAATDAAGKKASGAAAKVSDLQKVMQSLREEAAKLKATMFMSDTDAAVWENLNKAKVKANSAQGVEITQLTKQIEGMKSLKSATEEWRQTISSAFSDFITKGGSFKDMLGQILGKLVEMLMNQAFQNLWDASGIGKAVGGLFGGSGIGANANGTNNWRGGLTRVNERGGEVLNLPRGTQIIPHDLSKRMIDGQGSATPNVEVHIHENAVDGQNQVRQSPGRIDVMLRKELGDMVRGGALDGAFSQRFGMRARAAGGS